MPHWWMTLYCMWLCTHVYTATHSLVISTLLSSACNIGVVSLASEEGNRILSNGRNLVQGMDYFDLFSSTCTFVTAPLFQWLSPFLFLWLEWILPWGDITLHLLEDWTSQIQEVPWSTHPPTHPWQNTNQMEYTSTHLTDCSRQHH